ncbi:hypothetical protein K9M50_03195 [Patescibacteria group bacterium]|nr:hypothetical protein [Patescibacteria group bacterium]
MKIKNITANPKLLIQIIWEFLFFPIWWYSKGWFSFAKSLYGFLSWQSASLGVWVWLKNIFVPMYGQTDFSGRLISFFIRLVQIIFRGLLLLVIFVLCLTLFFLWALMPILIVYAIILQLI